MRLVVLLLVAACSWAAPVQRIVSTAPSITETLFAMGLGPEVVGVTIFDTYPPEVKGIPKIGTYLKPDVEAIVSLRPDLVVVQQLKTKLADHLAALHIRYVEVQSDNLAAVYAGALTIGKATDHVPEAERMISDIKAKLQKIATHSARYQPQPTALFLVGHTPGKLEGLIAGAGPSYFSDLLSAAGAKDALADSVAAYPKISLEEILSRDPDYIFEMSGESPASQEEILTLWQTHSTLRAVKNHHVFAVPSGPFVIPGPRAPEAARILFRFIHPGEAP